MIALPEGKWPESESGKQVVLNYKNTEGDPLLAVVEAYNMDSAQLTPSRFSDGFDPYKIVRITASKYMVDFIIQNKDAVPTVQKCSIGPLDESQATNPEIIQAGILNAISSSSCPSGVYTVNGIQFIARDGVVTLIDNSVE